jgi:hypothetical protein
LAGDAAHVQNPALEQGMPRPVSGNGETAQDVQIERTAAEMPAGGTSAFEDCATAIVR